MNADRDATATGSRPMAADGPTSPPLAFQSSTLSAGPRTVHDTAPKAKGHPRTHETEDTTNNPAAVTDTKRCLVMGILNVTPDSFSDGGCYTNPTAAVRHGLMMAAAGADYIDVGGESTRPGAHRVPEDEELSRVLPVVTALARYRVPVSVDTTRARVADAALNAGAVLVNDVSGGLADPGMASVVAAAHRPWVLMHWRAHSRHMDQAAVYDDVVVEVRRELLARVESALKAGVDAANLILDPGLGFAKHGSHDLTLLSRLDQIIDLGFPVLVGASRKRFLSAAHPAGSTRTSHPTEREAATIATTVLAAQAGAWAVRVHHVGPSADAVHLVAAVSGHQAVSPGSVHLAEATRAWQASTHTSDAPPLRQPAGA